MTREVARDYTDGHGWAKLDATCAHRLAETMCALRGRTADKRRDMLLWCFSRLSEGNPPTFRVGARTLAKACGHTRQAAREFLGLMDEEGWFVTTKEVEKGLTPERTFWWFAEGGGVQQHPTLGCKTQPQHPSGWGAEPSPSTPHQMAEPSDNGYGSAIPSPPPYPAPADAGPGGAGSEEYRPFVPPPAPTPPPATDEWGEDW